MLVPALLFCALLAFFGAVFSVEWGALTTVAVFFFGVVPHIKTKRADLLVSLHEQFIGLAANEAALASSADSQPTVDRAVASYAFFLRFWNLQLLQFGLWRYGMIPSDTYSHWIVRRLLSFRSRLKYWGVSPYEGALRVEKEFVGTDFHHFMQAAVMIHASVHEECKKPLVEGDRHTYHDLHTRIDRLLVAVNGAGLWSTSIVRIFATRRPPLQKTSVEAWAERTKSELKRERHSLRYAVLAGLAVPVAYVLGLATAVPLDWIVERVDAALGRTGASRSLMLEAGSPELVVVSSAGPIWRDVIRFDHEGACSPGQPPAHWHGAGVSTASRAVVDDIARALSACAKDGPVRVEVVGFASSSRFKDVELCQQEDIDTSEQANVALANARAANVLALLAPRVAAGAVAATARTWTTYGEMAREQSFVDRFSDTSYSTDRGALNRRVEIRVLDAGGCDPNR